jgi:hypothetical protein
MMNVREMLEPIAAFFRDLGIPEPITHWGHPAMMGIVVFVMGSYTAYAGWQGRTATDLETGAKNKADHKKLAPLLFLFIATGYTGGVLSLVIQDQPIMESPHFWTGSVVIGLLAVNGFISLTKFAGDKPQLRSLHAYLGSAAMALLFVHAFLGLKLGLSI